MNQKISAETITSSVLLLISAVNIVCNWLGLMPLEIEESTVYQLVSVVMLICTTAYSWWHNNSVTPEAIQADKVLDGLKQGDIKPQDLEEII